MNHTLTVTEREREVILEALKFLTDLFTKAAPAAAAQASAKPPEPGVQSTPIAVVNTRIWKAEPGKTMTGKECMRVYWGTQPAQPGQGRGMFSATCFEKQYFPALTNAVRTGQTIKLTVKKRGDYLNIVNVAA